MSKFAEKCHTSSHRTFTE